MRSSGRGALFKCVSKGNEFSIGVELSVSKVLAFSAGRSGFPFDIVLLTLALCAIAHADQIDFVDFTVYVPMRDGTAEAMMIGLFADCSDRHSSANRPHDAASAMDSFQCCA